jgi:hypothetical protein
LSPDLDLYVDKNLDGYRSKGPALYGTASSRWSELACSARSRIFCR